jgi:small-conductance mechanosensitive channel
MDGTVPIGKPLVHISCVTRSHALALAVVLFAATVQAAPPPPSRLPDGAQVLSFLNRTIAWSESVDAQADLVDQPTDVLSLEDNRRLARQVVGLSFEAAKAEAQFLAGSAGAAAASADGGPNRLQRLTRRASSAAEVLRREEARLVDLRARLAGTSADERPRLEAAVAEAESRVAMAAARNESASGIAGFASEAAGGNNDLLSQINALEQTIPAANAPNGSAPATGAARKAPPASVVGLIGDLLTLHQKDDALKSAIRAADLLQRDARGSSAPLMALMSQTRKRADALMNAPDSTDRAELLRRKAELDALSARYRGLSAAIGPLTKRRMVLGAYKANVTRWRSSVIQQYRGSLRRLMFRAIFLGVLLLLVVVIAVLWRHLAFRYVADVKRRHHLLLIRRIVLLVLVAGVLVATFASDFSSLTTFIGLVTAGVAIALQDVILSMAGYFVLIGKYGIRAGDRVRIASVNGDVLDVGLVWIYLMELETRGSDQLPTGRIVEFPNSVVFDHAAGIFKQLPGTRFLWHEVSLIVPPGSDFRATERRMLAAVESVFAEYRAAIEQQHRAMDRLLRITTEPPVPHSRLRIAPAGVEIRVRYPVEIEKAGDIDDSVAAAITDAA